MDHARARPQEVHSYLPQIDKGGSDRPPYGRGIHETSIASNGVMSMDFIGGHGHGCTAHAGGFSLGGNGSSVLELGGNRSYYESARHLKNDTELRPPQRIFFLQAGRAKFVLELHYCVTGTFPTHFPRMSQNSHSQSRPGTPFWSCVRLTWTMCQFSRMGFGYSCQWQRGDAAPTRTQPSMRPTLHPSLLAVAWKRPQESSPNVWLSE